MTPARRSLLVVLVVVAAVSIADAIMYVDSGWGGTISYLVLTRSQRYPILAFVLGVVIGHLLWPQPEPNE